MENLHTIKTMPFKSHTQKKTSLILKLYGLPVMHDRAVNQAARLPINLSVTIVC